MRLAKNGEQCRTLDEKEYVLSGDMIVIADDKQTSWNWWNYGRIS